MICVPQKRYFFYSLFEVRASNSEREQKTSPAVNCPAAPRDLQLQKKSFNVNTFTFYEIPKHPSSSWHQSLGNTYVNVYWPEHMTERGVQVVQVCLIIYKVTIHSSVNAYFVKCVLGGGFWTIAIKINPYYCKLMYEPFLKTCHTACDFMLQSSESSITTK